MPRIIFSVLIPKKAEELIVLSKLIVAKDTLDGVLSPLKVMNMVDMAAVTTEAENKDILSKQLNAQKELLYQERDNALGIGALSGSVDYYVKAARDILYALYKGVDRSLGDWGFIVDRKGSKLSINIPRKANELIILAEKIIAKNTELGVDSPITGLNIVDFTAKTETAREKNDAAIQINNDKEKATQLRDQYCGFSPKQGVTFAGTVLYYVTQARSVLLGLYKGTESVLGDWGFQVQHGTKPPAGKVSLNGSVSDVAGVVLSSVTVSIVELNKSTNTNSNGLYSFTQLPAGTYVLRGTKTGYKIYEKYITIETGVVHPHNFVLIALGGTLTVDVYHGAEPLANAAVKILETVQELTTGEDGSVTFTNIAAGVYNIEVTAPGYQPQIKPITITSGVSDMLVFEMIPG